MSIRSGGGSGSSPDAAEPLPPLTSPPASALPPAAPTPPPRLALSPTILAKSSTIGGEEGTPPLAEVALDETEEYASPVEFPPEAAAAAAVAAAAGGWGGRGATRPTASKEAPSCSSFSTTVLPFRRTCPRKPRQDNNCVTVRRRGEAKCLPAVKIKTYSVAQRQFFHRPGNQ